MRIYDYSLGTANGVFYTKGFMDVMESFMNYFRKSTTSEVHIVDQTRTLVYQGDLYGYLIEKGIPAHLHWLIMRASNMSSPYEFNENVKTLLVPSLDKIDQIRITYSVYTRK